MKQSHKVNIERLEKEIALLKLKNFEIEELKRDLALENKKYNCRLKQAQVILNNQQDGIQLKLIKDEIEQISSVQDFRRTQFQTKSDDLHRSLLDLNKNQKEIYQMEQQRSVERLMSGKISAYSSRASSTSKTRLPTKTTIPFHGTSRPFGLPKSPRNQTTDKGAPNTLQIPKIDLSKIGSGTSPESQTLFTGIKTSLKRQQQ